MTLFHFCNCFVLAYAPYIITYKYSILSEYSSHWKFFQAACIYMASQFLKMLLLATFFPTTETEDFNIFLELLKNSVDVIDLFGIHLALSYFISGRGEVKFLTTGLGWGCAHSLVSHFIQLFVGARTSGFSWRYFQTAINSNVDLLFYLSTSTLVWLLNRNELRNSYRLIVQLCLIYCVFRSVFNQATQYYLNLNSWEMIATKILITTLLSFLTYVSYYGLSSTQHSIQQKST